MWGSHTRQAANQQLARDGLVPVLPDAGDQPAQHAPPAEGQLSPAAAALQAALLAHVPAVSLDDLHQWVLTLHLFVEVRISSQLSAAELATLLNDCQLLLNCCTGSSGRLLAADCAARLLRVWVHGRRPTMQLRTLGRLGQLLEQAGAGRSPLS